MESAILFAGVSCEEKSTSSKRGYDFARFEKTTLKVSDFPENQNQVIFVRSIQTLRYA
jgi:hypothetical protein